MSEEITITAQLLYGHAQLHQVREKREDGRTWLGGYSTEHDRVPLAVRLRSQRIGAVKDADTDV